MSVFPITLNFNGKKNHGDPLYIGDSFSHPFTFFEKVDGVLIPDDKSSATFLSQIRDLNDNIIETFTVIVSGDDDNIVTISLSDGETAAIDPGEYRWDLQQTLSGVVRTLAKGELIAEGDVSRV